MGAAEIFLREEDHTYWVGDRRIPGVTSVIDHLTDYSIIPTDKLEIARQKGMAVHSMADLHAKGILDEDKLPEWMQPVFVQYQKLVRETGLRVVASEMIVYHPVYRYAGKLDRYVELAHAAEFAFLDFKRSFFAGKVTGMQLAAYKAAYIEQENDRSARKAKRYGVKLNEVGPYRMEPYIDEMQFDEFLACLSHQRIKEKYA